MSEKFIWTKEDTSLLISLWSDRSVQANLLETPRNVAIWTGIARYMRKRGIDVNWLQCRQRIKRLMARYRKIKRGAQLKHKNTTDSFFNELDLVLSKSRLTKLEADSSSLDNSNEATTAVEALLKQPKYDHQTVGIHPRPRQTLELKQTEIIEDKQTPTPKIELSRRRPTSDECVSDTNSVDVAFESQFAPVFGNHEAEHLDSTLPLEYVNSTSSDNPTKSGNKEKDPNYLVKQDESDAIMRVLLAQAETTQRLLEANRTRLGRLESKMDKIVAQLEQLIPVSNQGIAKKLEAKLNLVLNKLDQIGPRASVRTSECVMERKMEVVLGRLEHIIPCIEQYKSSAPNLVDKIDSLLTGLDRMAPYAYDLIEVNTDEKLGPSE